MDIATRNICLQTFVWRYVLFFLGYIMRNGITGSHGNYLIICGIIRWFSIVSAWYYVPNRNVWGFQFLPILPSTCHCLFIYFLAILVGVKWYAIVVLISISLMTNNDQNLLICLLVILVSSLEKHLFRPFDHILNLVCIFIV